MIPPTTTKKNSVEFVVQRPFGPSIGCCKLPQQLIDDFNKDCESIMDDEVKKKTHDHSGRLAGKGGVSVRQELRISSEVFARWEPLFRQFVEKYLTAHPQDKYPNPKMIFPSAWYVRSFAGDFIPSHFHTNCQLSCVGYLALPEGMEKEWTEEDKKSSHVAAAGSIEMIYGQVNMFSTHSVRVRPRVGDYYLFPWWMDHMVYPFRTEGERRSFAFNVVIEKNLSNGTT
jgi:uncharacterized protein (TIGR02466 family)